MAADLGGGEQKRSGAALARTEERRDGRHIANDLATLSGEAAEQLATRAGHNLQPSRQPYDQVPSLQDRKSPTYYDTPVLKEPVWIWSIPLYFYIGGAAGAGTCFGAAAQLAGHPALARIVFRSRWMGTFGGAMSAGLLIHDLGRPERFLNMLRVIRLSSPMSIGSWVLTIFSTAVGGAAVLQSGPRILRPLASLLGGVAGLFGLALAGYTAVLISQTAVPVWQQARRVMPFLFLGSGAASAAALFELMSLAPREARAVGIFGLGGKVLELGSALAYEQEVNRLERVGRPLHQGVAGLLWQAAKAFTAASLVISVLPGSSRKKRFLAGLLGTAGSICLRFGVVQAGKQSTRDPRASFEQQRAGLGAQQVTGRAAVTGPETAHLLS